MDLKVGDSIPGINSARILGAIFLKLQIYLFFNGTA